MVAVQTGSQGGQGAWLLLAKEARVAGGQAWLAINT